MMSIEYYNIFLSPQFQFPRSPQITTICFIRGQYLWRLLFFHVFRNAEILSTNIQIYKPINYDMIQEKMAQFSELFASDYTAQALLIEVN